MATDPASGNVVFTGNLSGTTDFGGGLVGPGGIFLAMYDSAGNHVWSKCFNLASRGYSSVDSGYGVSFDAAGNVTFSGQVSSVVSFDGYFTWSGPQNFFVASMSRTGSYRWAVRAGGTGQGVARAIAYDGLGHAVIGGTFTGTTDFGGTSLTVPSGSSPSFTTQYTQ